MLAELNDLVLKKTSPFMVTLGSASFNLTSCIVNNQLCLK